MKQSEVLKRHAMTYIAEIIKSDEPQSVIDTLKDHLSIVERKILANDEKINGYKINFSKQFANIKHSLDIDTMLNYSKSINSVKEENRSLAVIKEVLVDTIKIAETKSEFTKEQVLANALKDMINK